MNEHLIKNRNIKTLILILVMVIGVFVCLPAKPGMPRPSR
jgi:hypothetical protein